MNKTPRILIVEDDSFNISLYKSLTEKWDTLIVANGSIALEVLEHNTFDLVLMDIEMPVMDGFQATKQIRSKLGLTLPIIAVSSYTCPGIYEKAMEAGMNDFLPKPFETCELSVKILKHLCLAAQLTENNEMNR